MIIILKLQTNIEGKKACFGQMRDHLQGLGYVLGGGWDYDRGNFDSILWREGGETIYLRIPFLVYKGMLDEYNTLVEFQTPYIIKHVVNTGLDRDEGALLSATGLSQFQEPLDTDGYIRDKNKWEEIGQQAVQQVIQNIVHV